MTQKEKLYEQVLIAENEYKSLKRDKHLLAIEGMKNGGLLAINAKGYSLAELKEMLTDMQAKIEAAKQAKVVEEYFSTPEGAKRKAKLESERESNLAATKNLLSKYIAETKALIEPILPENWKMDCTDVRYIKICLTDPVDGKNVFGHDFELRLNEDWDRNDRCIYTLTSNMGTMGSFDPLKDMKRVSLYKVFSDIISNAELMDSLRSIMIQASGSIWQCRENIINIDKQLKNPLA